MVNQRVKRWPKIFLGQLLVALVIIIFASSLIFYAQGWRINLKTLKIYKTGLFLYKSSPVPDKIFIGNESYDGKKEFSFNLLPGSYTVRAEKSGYVEWSREITIKQEMVSFYDDTLLFYSKPKIEDLTDQSKIDFLNNPDTILLENARDNLAFNKYEIWTGDKLITRFSEPINGVEWYPDMKHILFQQGDEIRIIDNDGFNNTLLVKLSSTQPSKFQIGGKGLELYYSDGEKYKKAIIK